MIKASRPIGLGIMGLVEALALAIGTTLRMVFLCQGNHGVHCD